MGEMLKEHSGFTTGQRVRMRIETKGADHEDIEHTLPAGSVGIIDSIERYDNDQGVNFAVWIPVDEEEGRGIVNNFDEIDGPIGHFLEAL